MDTERYVVFTLEFPYSFHVDVKALEQTNIYIYIVQIIGVSSQEGIWTRHRKDLRHESFEKGESDFE